MIILGIETSCDETALCLLETKEKNGTFEYKILGNIVHSQISLHTKYGGVFPALAKREHIKNLPILFEKIKKEAHVEEKDIDAVAVTRGPGLEPALWTGIDFAKEISKRNNIPVIPINHMEGHVVSSLLKKSRTHDQFESLKEVEFPGLAVLISGGHTELVAVENIGSYKILGRTKDDAVGEAFDKVARMLGLPYPGGPQISKLAQEAREKNLPQTITFPRPMIASKDLNFSFSGLKTSVLYKLKEIGTPTPDQKLEIAREFEDAITEVITTKTKTALDEGIYKALMIGGGVIANPTLRKAFETIAEEYSIPLYLPLPELTGDNALMIALVGAFHASTMKNSPDLTAEGNLSL